MAKQRFTSAFRATMPFILLALSFLVGTFLVLSSAMNHFLERDATLAGIRVERALTSAMLEQSGKADAASAINQTFRGIAEAENVVALRVLSPTGKVVSQYVWPTAKAAQRYKAETTVARADGERLELLIDQSQRRSDMMRELAWNVIALAFLTVCSFGVPAIVHLRDIGRRMRGEEQIAFLAHHDPLTSLLNRAKFKMQLDEKLADAPSLAVHYVDVDRFKSVNDTLGHSIGDEVIKEVGRRLQALMGPNDFVARYGGDEFVMTQVDVSSQSEVEQRAAAVRRAIQDPLRTGDHQVKVTASVGSALCPRDGRTTSELEKAADLALYCAKADGRDTCRIYDPAMDAALNTRRTIEKALLGAFASDGFDLHFQPIVEPEGKLLGFEVLLRLQNETGESIPPVDFIPIAEDMGLISQVGAWVIRRACAVAASWPDHLTIAVNMSPRQFENGDLCGIVEAALTDSGLAPARLELEITEGLLVSDTERVLEQLHKLKKLGVSIAMDDFGTGYSSLSYLWQFPFDKLKIDRSFMQVVGDNGGQISSILNTIISLGRTLDLKVTAEGVETAEQALLLKELNCHQLQGYYFGRPAPESDVAATIISDLQASMHRTDQPRISLAGLGRRPIASPADPIAVAS